MPRGAGISSKAAKPAVKSTTDTKVSSGSSFLSRASFKPGSSTSAPTTSSSNQQRTPHIAGTRPVVARVDSVQSQVDFDPGIGQKSTPAHSRPASIRSSSEQSIAEEESYQSVLNRLGQVDVDESQSISSSHCEDKATSIYSSASSIYSSASSIYSSGASIYAIEENEPDEQDHGARDGTDSVAQDANVRPLHRQKLPGTTVRRQESQDEASRERSALAKKAAQYQNSRLRPNLPSFNISLQRWSMVCRAAQASEDCYGPASMTRRGQYTPADTSKDIKAMVVDEQFIDGTRYIIVAIRGTSASSLTDWSVNKKAKLVQPTEFLDDVESMCHAGFLQVTKSMIGHVATQLREHPATSKQPSLLFTGHSAGGAVAAMLYSHMLSISVRSDLTTLAENFSSINCVTFGAPPLSSTPLPERAHGSGVFLSFANEGDLVVRFSNAAYMKSVAKLMTSSTSVVPAAPVKVIRRSRGSAVVIQQAAAPVIPWEELPLWPTPPASLTNAGNIVLLRDNKNGCGTASTVTSEDLKDVIFADLAQHSCEMYMRRIKDVVLSAMMGTTN